MLAPGTTVQVTLQGRWDSLSTPSLLFEDAQAVIAADLAHAGFTVSSFVIKTADGLTRLLHGQFFQGDYLAMLIVSSANPYDSAGAIADVVAESFTRIIGSTPTARQSAAVGIVPPLSAPSTVLDTMSDAAKKAAKALQDDFKIVVIGLALVAGAVLVGMERV